MSTHHSEANFEVPNSLRINHEGGINLSPQMRKQMGVYFQILQKRQSLQETSLLKGTILADKINPKIMFRITIKILIAIIILIYFTNLFLPSPLKVETATIPHNAETTQQCTEKTCANYIDFIQEMEIKKLSPLNRKIEVYLEMDQNQMKRYAHLYQDIGDQTLVEQIERVEIFKTNKENQTIEERVSLVEGSEIIEEIVDGKPMYYAGDLHVIDCPNFLIRVVKKSKRNSPQANSQQEKIRRRLQQSNEKKSEGQAVQNQKSQTEKLNQNPQTQPEKNLKSETDNQGTRNRQTQPQTQSQTQPQSQPEPEPQPQPQPQPQAQKESFPLIITAFYHSFPFTFLQLLFRFIFLVLCIYVISQTPESPRLLHWIMISYCNPFIFLQVASPNIFFSLVSSICQSSYMGFFLIFIYYTHSRSQNAMVHYCLLSGKLFIVFLLFVVNVLRLQHTFEDFQVYTVQTTLLICVFVILGAYVWDMIVYYKQQLYRDIVTVTIILWYMLIGFVSNWAIVLGWEELIRFVIVQIFAINLCYLVNKYQTNPRWNAMMKTLQSISSQDKEKSNSFQELSAQTEISPPVDSDHQLINQQIKLKMQNGKNEHFLANDGISPNRIQKNEEFHHENDVEHKISTQNHKNHHQRKIKFINVRTNEISYS